MAPKNLLNKIDFFQRITGQADVFLAITIITVVALLVVPIPTFLVDLLISANISVALVVLLLAIYIPDTLKLSTFPTILLITTLFRLGLNVATSRLILLNADAGEVVLAFGESVVGGSLVVGIVIFLLLMLINMLVVAKGSERVAEVAARFTLDAMPGKQMSIDADLRSGLLDNEQAKQKRLELSRESQLFGAMDGAMKFVKGDVIAGIVIFVINIVAGIIIGKFEHNMEIDEALQTFAILSVGDGLVSIIPGLLMSLCAGLIVTRVESSGSKNLGENVVTQILGYPKAFIIASIFIGLVGQIPGLPTLPFTLLAIISLMIGLTAQNREKNLEQEKSKSTSAFDRDDELVEQTQSENQNSLSSRPAGVIPICIEVGRNLIPYVNDQSNFIDHLIPILRDSLEMELGLEFPGIRVRPGDPSLGDCEFLLLLNEIPVEKGIADPRFLMVSARLQELKSLGINNAHEIINPCTHLTCTLTDKQNKDILEKNSFMVWDAPSRILLHLSAILRKNAKDFLTIHETQTMLDKLETQYPSLVKEVVPKAVNLFQLTEILKRLLSEEISIRDLKSILQSLSEVGPYEQNTVTLSEKVRESLARYICFRSSQGSPTLVVYLLSPEIEDMIRSSIETQGNESFLALEPELGQEIINAVQYEVSQLPPSARQPVILTSQETRRFLRKLLELEFPELMVVSYQELSPDFKIQPIGRINLRTQIEEYNDESFEGRVPSPFESAVTAT